MATNTSPDSSNSNLGWIALAFAPLFFSTNIIFGKAAISIDPFTLAALRWFFSALILSVIIRGHWPTARRLIARHWRLLFLCGFLGMGICGGLVYLALKYTTATNGTLIYTTPPLMIIVMERVVNGRKISGREIFGIIAAMLGISVIVSGGNPLTLFQVQMNIGDLMFLVSAVAWAIYSLLLKSSAYNNVPTLVVLAVTAGFGSLSLLPFAVAEVLWFGNFPRTSTDWQLVAGIVAFSSLIPFALYQYGNRIHGPTSASVFMYLLPPFGLGFAWLFLGEVPGPVTWAGCLLVLGGVIFATLPKRFLLKN